MNFELPKKQICADFVGGCAQVVPAKLKKEITTQRHTKSTEGLTLRAQFSGLCSGLFTAEGLLYSTQNKGFLWLQLGWQFVIY